MKVAALALLVSAVLAAANPVEQLDERDSHLEKRRTFVGTANPNAGELNCREGPSTKYKVIDSFAKGDRITITCQTTGDNIGGNRIWNRISRAWWWEQDCYVADRYTKTGSSWIHGVPRC